jgi:hypothetical protein
MCLSLTVYLLLWFTDHAPFYTTSGPVLSPFTAISLIILCGCRLARKHLEVWPMPLSMAWIGIVIGGQIASISMLSLVPRILVDSFPTVVPTAPITSFGLLCFCLYELLIIIRETPKQGLIVDDMLLHLALVPGTLSLIGHFLNTPSYVSSDVDPRVGISLLEMMFMGLYAVAASISNGNLFLWRFLARQKTNVMIFIILVTNQFIAPLVVAYLMKADSDIRQPGVEVFVLLAGVLATLSFLSIQAYLERRR